MLTDDDVIWSETLTPEAEASRGQGLSEPILMDAHRMNEDVRLVARAVKHRWPLKRSKCRGLVDRLFGITEKTAVMVTTKTGETESVDGPADANAIAAARVLVQMMGQNQADESPTAKEQTNVGVNVNVNTAVQSAATAEVIRSDPRFVDFLESQITCESVASVVGSARVERSLPISSAHPGAE